MVILMGYRPKGEMSVTNRVVLMLMYVCIIGYIALTVKSISIQKRQQKIESKTITINSVSPAGFFNKEIVVTNTGDIIVNYSGYDGIMKVGGTYCVTFTDNKLTGINKVISKQ